MKTSLNLEKVQKKWSNHTLCSLKVDPPSGPELKFALESIPAENKCLIENLFLLLYEIALNKVASEL